MKFENLITPAFIDIPLIAYSDLRITSFDKLFNEYIFINLNTICNEKECYTENDSIVNFYVKKYEILRIPKFLTINAGVNDFNTFLDNKNFINTIFKNEIYFMKNKFDLIGFITQPNASHFVAYFKNFNSKYINSIDRWYKYDDMIGYCKEINNPYLALYNIRATEGIALLIYVKYD